MESAREVVDAVFTPLTGLLEAIVVEIEKDPDGAATVGILTDPLFSQLDGLKRSLAQAGESAPAENLRSAIELVEVVGVDIAVGGATAGLEGLAPSARLGFVKTLIDNLHEIILMIKKLIIAIARALELDAKWLPDILLIIDEIIAKILKMLGRPYVEDWEEQLSEMLHKNELRFLAEVAAMEEMRRSFAQP